MTENEDGEVKKKRTRAILSDDSSKEDKHSVKKKRKKVTIMSDDDDNEECASDSTYGETNKKGMKMKVEATKKVTKKESKKKEKKNKKNENYQQEDEDDGDYYDKSDDCDDSDAEEDKQIRRRIELIEDDIFEFLNKETPEEITSMVNISAKRLEILLSLRPFKSFKDMVSSFIYFL